VTPPVSSHTIRTGDLAQDQRQLNEAQQYANANGLLMQVYPLPHGGFQVDMLRPGAVGPAGYPPPQAQGMMVAPSASVVPVAPFGGVAARPPAPVVSVAGVCRACGRHAPTRQVTFHQNIGALIMRFPKTVSGQLCRDCIGKYFRDYTLTSLFLGWWGIISFFYTLVTIPMNVVTYLKARDLPRSAG
jgi:hypothetical protein